MKKKKIFFYEHFSIKTYFNMYFYFQVEYKQDLATPSTPGLVSALPEECIREILLRLSDPSDLDR